jgi:hypothetical protein
MMHGQQNINNCLPCCSLDFILFESHLEIVRWRETSSVCIFRVPPPPSHGIFSVSNFYPYGCVVKMRQISRLIPLLWPVAIPPQADIWHPHTTMSVSVVTSYFVGKYRWRFNWTFASVYSLNLSRKRYYHTAKSGWHNSRDFILLKWGQS